MTLNNPKHQEHKMNIFLVIAKRAEHSAHVVVENLDDIWTPNNPAGWTYQELTGAYGDVLGEFESEEDANALYDLYMQCDAIENNRYCYTHNPNPKRD